MNLLSTCARILAVRSLRRAGRRWVILPNCCGREGELLSFSSIFSTRLAHADSPPDPGIRAKASGPIHQPNNKAFTSPTGTLDRNDRSASHRVFWPPCLQRPFKCISSAWLKAFNSGLGLNSPCNSQLKHTPQNGVLSCSRSFAFESRE